MGTYTDFTGAIRITPCLKEPLAGRFRQFLGIRHMKRDVKILEALFPTLEERKAVTLFGDGDFGEDGAFFLPIHTRDLTRRICLHERYAEGLTDERDMNMTPGPCPSLYCDLELRNDPDNGHSYLGWNEAEKASTSRIGSDTLPSGSRSLAITSMARCSLWSRAACPTTRSRWMATK